MCHEWGVFPCEPLQQIRKLRAAPEAGETSRDRLGRGQDFVRLLFDNACAPCYTMAAFFTGISELALDRP
jgi:hypothetical protein